MRFLDYYYVVTASTHSAYFESCPSFSRPREGGGQARPAVRALNVRRQPRSPGRCAVANANSRFRLWPETYAYLDIACIYTIMFPTARLSTLECRHEGGNSTPNLVVRRRREALKRRALPCVAGPGRRSQLERRRGEALYEQRRQLARRVRVSEKALKKSRGRRRRRRRIGDREEKEEGSRTAAAGAASGRTMKQKECRGRAPPRSAFLPSRSLDPSLGDRAIVRITQKLRKTLAGWSVGRPAGR